MDRYVVQFHPSGSWSMILDMPEWVTDITDFDHVQTSRKLRGPGPRHIAWITPPRAATRRQSIKKRSTNFPRRQYTYCTNSTEENLLHTQVICLPLHECSALIIHEAPTRSRRLDSRLSTLLKRAKSPERVACLLLWWRRLLLGLWFTSRSLRSFYLQ